VKRVLLITGSPGIGKTTLLTKSVDTLRRRGYNIGGMISREVREAGTRIGFEILDLDSQKHGWLAHVNQKVGPQVGKYHVNLTDLEAIGANAISHAVENCEIIAIDEIGPMELFSGKFRNAVKNALKSNKPVLAVIHSKANDRLVHEAKARDDVEVFTVTAENRDKLGESIAERASRENWVGSQKH